MTNGHLTEASAIYAALQEASAFGSEWRHVVTDAGDVGGHPMLQLRLIRHADGRDLETNTVIARDVPAAAFCANASRAWAQLRQMHQDAKRWLEV